MITVYHRPRKTHLESRQYQISENEYGYRDEEVSETPTSRFSIEESEKYLTLKYHTLCCELPVEGEFKLEKEQYKGKVIICGIIQTEVKNKQVIFPMFEHVSSTSFRRTSGKSYDENFLGRFCFEENGDVNVFLFHRIDDVEGFTNVIVNPDETSIGVLYQKSEVFKQAFDAFKRKGKMLEDLDIFNSIAYLEAQSDAMAKLIVNLIELSGNAEKVDQKALKILNASNENSVLNIKPLEKCLNEINKHKANVRKLQQRFYDSK